MNNKANAMTGVLITLGVLVMIAIIFGAWIAGSYNTLGDKDTTVEAQWGNIQSAYERRLDLIPRSFNNNSRDLFTCSLKSVSFSNMSSPNCLILSSHTEYSNVSKWIRFISSSTFSPSRK